MSKLGEPFKLPTFRVLSGNGENGRKQGEEPWWKRTLDPSSEVVLMWNRIFLVACFVALFVDPLFFYLPQIETDHSGDESSLCMSRNMPLGVVLTFFRTLADAFYALHVLVRFRTAFVAPSSRVFGIGELVRDRKQIAWRYIKTGFFFDLIAALPLPQVAAILLALQLLDI